MGEAKKRKLSRHATNDEIFGGDHAPVQSSARDTMIAVMDTLKGFFPDHEITLFLAEKKGQNGQLPRFNYASTADRRDMYAVLRAFLEKNAAIAEKLDKIEDAPPTGSRQ
jgi:glycerol-3-phosphate responsive antiterminator